MLRATVAKAIPVTLEDVMHALVEIRALLVEERRRPVDDERRFLLAVAAAVTGCAFTAAELRAHAVVDAALRDVLGNLTSRQIGKRLRRLSGRTIAGLEVRRVGRDGDGVIWTIGVSADHLHAGAGGRGRGRV